MRKNFLGNRRRFLLAFLVSLPLGCGAISPPATASDVAAKLSLLTGGTGETVPLVGHSRGPAATVLAREGSILTRARAVYKDATTQKDIAKDSFDIFKRKILREERRPVAESVAAQAGDKLFVFAKPLSSQGTQSLQNGKEQLANEVSQADPYWAPTIGLHPNRVTMGKKGKYVYYTPLHSKGTSTQDLAHLDPSQEASGSAWGSGRGYSIGS